MVLLWIKNGRSEGLSHYVFLGYYGKRNRQLFESKEMSN